MIIRHSRPCFDENDRLSVEWALGSGFVAAGAAAQRFASVLARGLGRKWAIPVNSGTDAIVLALKVLDLGENAKIAVPAYACGAILDAVALVGMRPVAVDIDRASLGMRPDLADESRCEGIVAAHLFGIASPFYRIKNPNLVEDCAQCLGAAVDGRMVGSMGKFAVTSFYATKIITTGHGGALCGDSLSARKAASDILRHDKIKFWRGAHLHISMSDFNAALGLSQFARLDAFIKARRRIAMIYREVLGEKGPIPRSEMCYRFIVTPARAGGASGLIAKFAKSGIEAKKPVFKPIYRFLGLSARDFPNAAWADRNLVSVPIYPAMKDSEIEKVADFLRRNKDEIRCRPSA